MASLTYVRFHQSSVTPAKVGDAARKKKKATQVNHMAKNKELCSEGGNARRWVNGGASKWTKVGLFREEHGDMDLTVSEPTYGRVRAGPGWGESAVI